MMEYEFMQFSARELQRRAAHERLVREAALRRRREQGGLLGRLVEAVRQGRAEAAPARLREC